MARSAGRKWLIILPPLLFLLVFFLIPFGFALSISFADTAVRVPPFTDILSVSPDWHIHLTLNLGNFKYLFTDEVYGLSYLYSLEDRVFLDADLSGAGLSDGLRHRADLQEHAKHPAAHHHPALLDLVPAARLCARGNHSRDRAAQYRAAVAGSHRPSAADHAHHLRRVSRNHLFLPAVHGPAAVCDARETGSFAARSGRRSGQPALARLPRRHAAAVHARHHRRLHAGVHSGHRRIRHPDPARRPGQSDDRPGAVGRILRQPRLAGGLRGGHRISWCCWSAPSPSISTTAPSSSRRRWRTGSRHS